MSNPTRNLHVWKTRTAEGQKREVRAQLFGAQWSFTARVDSEEDFTAQDPPSLEDLEALYEVLFNKYQRKHLAWEHLVGLKKIIESRRR
ncbi:MAG: hypothetical protein GC161_01960 [Planctomycetaceae bacterium]|nr:hypothetical protein [Planctomycetaceae bacterium]